MLPVPYCSWGHCRCFCSPVPPCASGRSLLGRGLCGYFLVLSASWRLVWASLTPGAHPLSCRACVHLFWLSGGLCALVSAYWGALCIPGLVWTCSAPLASLSMVAGFICTYFVLPPALWGLYVLWAVPGGLRALPNFVCLSFINTPALAFALWGFCAPAVFVCRPHLARFQILCSNF